MALRLLLGRMVMCNSLLFPSMVGDDHAAGLLCYANVLRRSSGSPLISLRKADQRHDLASTQIGEMCYQAQQNEQ